MHILDLIMYFVVIAISWKIIDWTSDGEFTQELGTIAGMFICAIITIAYIILFAAWPDYNWIDIFHWFGNPSNFKLNIKW